MASDCAASFNLPLGAERFRFIVPPGVDVFEQ